MPSGQRRLFIYYRLAERDLAPACTAARHAQAALCARHAGLVAALLRRPEASVDGLHTVMETYVMDAQFNPAGIDAALQDMIDTELAAALRPWLAAQTRHVEVFVE
ncbi:DUF4936 family protein [Ideonella sp. BN130291]|uniref:DUF4936 family protein n=1 Tax=Ideonella sp. BN130291 TaxID=3112940 RepID=UPI002E2610D1|nr:DUF4936 family protein [Ideonella sp. BN130291]